MLTARSTRTSGGTQEPGTNCSEAAADAALPAQHGSLTGLLHGPPVAGRRHQAGTTAAAVPGCVGRDCLEAHQRVSRGGGHTQQGLASMQGRDSVANPSLLTLAAQQQLRPEGELAHLYASAEQHTKDAQPAAPASRAPANLRHTPDSAAAALDWPPSTGAALAAAAHTRHSLTGAAADFVELDVESDEPPLDPGTVGMVVMEGPIEEGCDHDSAREDEAAGADVAASTVAALQQLQRIALAADRSPEQPGLGSDRLKVRAGLQQALPPAPAAVAMSSRRGDSRRQAHANTQCQQQESASATALATVAASAARTPVTGTQQLPLQGQLAVLAVDRLGSALGTMATHYAASGHNGSHLPDSGSLDDIIALALGASGPAPHPEHPQLPQPPSRPAASGVLAGEGVTLGEQQAAVAAEPGAAIVIPAPAVAPQHLQQVAATGPIGPWAASEKALPLLSAGSVAVAGPASESKQLVAAKPAAQLGAGTQQGLLPQGQAAAAAASGATVVTYGGDCDGQSSAVAPQKGSQAQRLRGDGVRGGRVQGGRVQEGRVQGGQVQGGQVQAQPGGVQGAPGTPGSDLEGGTGPHSLAHPFSRSSVRKEGHADHDGSECGAGAVSTVAGCAEVCGGSGEQADMVTMDVLAILG